VEAAGDHVAAILHNPVEVRQAYGGRRDFVPGGASL
jgi:hypothetical protein